MKINRIFQLGLIIVTCCFRTTIAYSQVDSPQSIEEAKKYAQLLQKCRGDILNMCPDGGTPIA